jgi:hypothetical protein
MRRFCPLKFNLAFIFSLSLTYTIYLPLSRVRTHIEPYQPVILDLQMLGMQNFVLGHAPNNMDGAENPGQSSLTASSEPSTQDMPPPPPPAHTPQPLGLSKLDLQMISMRAFMLDLALDNKGSTKDPAQSCPPASSEPPAPDGPDVPSPPPRVLTEVGARIEPSPDYLSVLQHEKLFPGNLKASGYPLEQLSRTDLEKKARCQRCSRGGLFFFDNPFLHLQS